MPKALGALAIVTAALLVFARTAHYGLFSDDFNWLVGAQMFDAHGLFDLSYRTHFFRPVVELYFPAAMAACGRSAECYHWLNIGLHAGTGLLVGALAGSISRNSIVGVLAGVLFVGMPGPVEAVAWVACVPEVLAALWFVATVWLFRRAVASGERWSYGAAALCFVACLLTHESGVTLLPILAFSIWLVPPEGVRQIDSRTVRLLAPLAVILMVYLVVEYIINSRNYLVKEGQYALGEHMLSNALTALATFAVTPHSLLWLTILGILAIWAVLGAPPRIKFYALWTLVALAPVVGFRGGLTSRYLYLPAVGFAALTAELLWSARSFVGGRPSRAGIAVWWVVVVALTVRFASFAMKNATVWQTASVPFLDYAARVRQLYPAPARGVTLEVPPPPEEVLPQYLPSLLQWEFGDPTLRPVVRDR